MRWTLVIILAFIILLAGYTVWPFYSLYRIASAVETRNSASAVPISGSIPGATAPAPELQKAYYYRRAYRRGYYGGYYGYGGYYDYRGYRYYYGGYPSYSYGYPGNF
jgi:hypothetical protein